MAAGVFIITELVAGDPSNAGNGERFEWTASNTPTQPFNGSSGGGARACPFKPWRVGGQMRMVRTDYPNARKPSVQIMGPKKKPHTFRGRFDDRHNGAGYAVFEYRRLEAVFERASTIRLQYGPEVYEGIADNWDFDIRKLHDIGYEFVVDVHGRTDDATAPRIPPTPLDPGTLLDRYDVSVQAMLDADEGCPRTATAGTLANDVTEALVACVNVREELAATIDQRDVAPPEHPVDAFTRIATQFRAGRGAAYDLLVRLAAVRADLDMATMTAISVLEWEDWTRSLRYMARLTMGTAIVGDRSSTERAEPDAVRLYRPHAGEHLYAIARDFYGDARCWTLIFARNSLHDMRMSGTETLIIPERGGV